MSDLAVVDELGTLTLVRHLPGPIDRVWKYLTDPEFLAKWFSGGVVADCVGGKVRFDMGAFGRITAYEPMRLLEYSWNEEDAAVGPVENSVVRWELAQEGSGVRLTLTQSRLPNVEVLAHCAGWHCFLDRLASVIDGREPEPVMELFARLKAVYEKGDGIN